MTTAPTPSHLSKSSAARLVAAAPRDLWGALYEGRFYSEAAVDGALRWLKSISADSSFYAAARTLGWGDPWRQRLWRVAEGKHRLKEAMLLALHADLGRYIGDRSSDNGPLAKGEDVGAQKARIRWIYHRAFEGALTVFATAIGMSKTGAYLSMYADNVAPSERMLAGLRKAGVNPMWILTGAGDILADDAHLALGDGVELYSERRGIGDGAAAEYFLRTVERLIEGEPDGTVLSQLPERDTAN